MSVFREVSETHLLETAEPLATNGSTCLCYKVKLYDRWQFIKRLRPELESNSRYVSLFTKEYMVGSRLSHPNLVSYNEMDTSDEGVMMLLDYVEARRWSRNWLMNPCTSLTSTTCSASAARCSRVWIICTASRSCTLT